MCQLVFSWQHFVPEGLKVLQPRIMTEGHDPLKKRSNQPAGPPQGLIWQYFCSALKYTEAEPRDFKAID